MARIDYYEGTPYHDLTLFGYEVWDIEFLDNGWHKIKNGFGWMIFDPEAGQFITEGGWDEIGEYCPIEYPTTYLIPVKLNGKWGLIDNQDREIISCQWDEIVIPWDLWDLPYNHVFVKVLQNEKWGLLDPRDGCIITECQWDELALLEDSYSYYIKIQQNGKWGLLTDYGSVITPCQWDQLEIIRDNFAGIQKDGKWGIMDMDGRILHPCQEPNFQNLASICDHIKT